ncbi:MAG: zinc-binding dehydrogenase [Candidatus Acidiferrales bacterium]
MMTSRAAVLTKYDAPLQLTEFPLPSALEPGAALVRITLTGVCGTDVHLWHGQLPLSLPVILGHESVGVIEQIGPGRIEDWEGRPLARGQRITWSSSITCGMCYYCRVTKQPTRCLKRKAYGISYVCTEPPHLLGGYAEHIYLRPGTSIFALPETLTTEAVVGAGCALATSIHGLERMGIEWQDTVVIQGSGPVGLACLALVRDRGAGKTIVIGGPAHRIELAKRFGADHCIDVTQTLPADRKKLVMDMTEGFGADTVLECVGIPQAVEEGLELCRDGARYLVLGHYGNAGTIPFNPHVVTRKQMVLGGSWGFEPRHTDAGLRFLSRTRDRFPFENLIGKPFTLDQANEALQATAHWQTGKSAIAP